MKILHVIFSLQTGGSENMLVDILNEQIKIGRSVGLLIINDDYNRELIDKIDSRVSIKYIGRIKSSKKIFPILKFNAFILKYKPDVLHIHDHKAIELLLLRNVKTVLTVHALELDQSNWNKYDVLCAISKAVQNDISTRSGLSSSLVYNGVDLRKIIKKDAESEKSGKIVQISRLDHTIKGQDVLIRALSIIKQRCSNINISVDFIGEGVSLDYLQNLTNELGLSDSIRFLGNKSRDYIYTHLHEYDLLVQPSIYEGFGLAVVEGIAACVPVLVSDNDGPMEIIKDGEFGYYFKNSDTEECAAKIEEIINTKERCELINKAYIHVSKYFDIEKTARNYLNVYAR